MNIFYLDSNPRLAAEYQCNKHVVKMILETAQLLSTAHRVLDEGCNISPLLYKATHKNHPSAIWVRSGADQYRWAFDHFCFLLQEYYYRYDKIHKSDSLREHLIDAPLNIDWEAPWSEPPLCMPEEYKSHDTVTECYRHYYAIAKKDLLQYKRRDPPYWLANINTP